MVSTLLLLGRMKGAASAPAPGGALALTLSGSPQTLSYSAPLGRYPSGAARTLFVQFTRTLTNGSPDTGTLTVPGRSIAVAAHRSGSGTASTLVSFSVPLQDGDIPSSEIANCTTGTWTDDSATWSNSNTTTWYTGGTGRPAGVLWPTSAAHLCASSPFGPLIAQASQPSFTGSAGVDTALSDTITTTVLGWNGSWPYTNAAAQYERTIALYEYACRTADITALWITIAHASRMRTAFWASYLGGVGEQWQEMKSWLWCYLFRRDTVLLGNNDASGLMFIASNVYQFGAAGVGTWFHAENPRFAAARIKACTAVIKAGRGDEQNQYTTGTFYEMGAALLVEGLATGSTKMTQTNNRVTLVGYTNDGSTTTRTVFPYMVGLYVRAMLELLDVLPSSANKTAMYAQLSASVLWLRQNMTCTSETGTRNYLYQDVDVWYLAVPGSLTANYTAGSTSMSIRIASAGSAPPDGWDAGQAFSAGCVVRIGGVSKQITALFSTNGSGDATVTLESGGFGSSYSSGQAITFVRDSAVGVSVENVDLNGFLAPLFAWRALYEASVTDANEARTLYATIGYTPQDGHTGPYLTQGKQWDESFNESQPTLAYLSQAGI